ncbi:MAG TPA: NAD(P)H-binding protein [Saprospiraceae bacterium]|nr:NAD(P)H-binding protein [Saprospiraceae bacterium]HND87049.1 NAD(P)H-binding protein [Saprospiraceae bacterium]
MTVNIFGATGLIGSHLLQACLSEPRIAQVQVFVRRPLAQEHPKLVQTVATLDTLERIAPHISGEVVLNCLGTTLRQAGSQAAQYAVDCEYPVRVAQIAARNGVKCMISVSSVGASETGNFYLKTKAAMEQGVKGAMPVAYFLRPSLLKGQRQDTRIGEKIGFGLMFVAQPLLQRGWKKYRAISARTVAQAMLRLALQQPSGPRVLHYAEIVEWAG